MSEGQPTLPDPPQDQIIEESRSESRQRPIPDQTARLMRWSLIYLVFGILTMWCLTMGNYYLTNQDQRYENISKQLEELRGVMEKKQTIPPKVVMPKIDLGAKLDQMRRDILEQQKSAIAELSGTRTKDLTKIGNEISFLAETLKASEGRISKRSEEQARLLASLSKRIDDQAKNSKKAIDNLTRENVVLKNGIKGQQLMADGIEKRLTTLTQKLQKELKLFLPPPSNP
jgi:hypothetical protein